MVVHNHVMEGKDGVKGKPLGSGLHAASRFLRLMHVAGLGMSPASAWPARAGVSSLDCFRAGALA